MHLDVSKYDESFKTTEIYVFCLVKDVSIFTNLILSLNLFAFDFSIIVWVNNRNFYLTDVLWVFIAYYSVYIELNRY